MKGGLIALMLFVIANTLHASDQQKAVLHIKEIKLEVKQNQLKSAAKQRKKTVPTLRKSYAAAAAAQGNKPQSRKPATTQTQTSPLDLTVIGAAIKKPLPANAHNDDTSDGDDDCPSDSEFDDNGSDLCMAPKELAECGYNQAPVFFDDNPLILRV